MKRTHVFIIVLGLAALAFAIVRDRIAADAVTEETFRENMTVGFTNKSGVETVSLTTQTHIFFADAPVAVQAARNANRAVVAVTMKVRKKQGKIVAYHIDRIDWDSPPQILP